MSFAIWFKPGRPLRRPFVAGLVFATYTACFQRKGSDLGGFENVAPRDGFYVVTMQKNPLPPPQLRRHGYRLVGLTCYGHNPHIDWDLSAFFAPPSRDR